MLKVFVRKLFQSFVDNDEIEVVWLNLTFILILWSKGSLLSKNSVIKDVITEFFDKDRLIDHRRSDGECLWLCYSKNSKIYENLKLKNRKNEINKRTVVKTSLIPRQPCPN